MNNEWQIYDNLTSAASQLPSLPYDFQKSAWLLLTDDWLPDDC